MFWTSRHSFPLLMGALIFVKSLFLTSRQIFLRCAFVFIFQRCSPLGEVVVLDLEAHVSPFDGCSHFGEVGDVDLEAYLFFIVLSFW